MLKIFGTFLVCLLCFLAPAMAGNFLANKFREDIEKVHLKLESFVRNYVSDLEKNIGVKIEDII
jgi:hypothetical protein